jgi:hypothetical protein
MHCKRVPASVIVFRSLDNRVRYRHTISPRKVIKLNSPFLAVEELGLQIAAQSRAAQRLGKRIFDKLIEVWKWSDGNE